MRRRPVRAVACTVIASSARRLRLAICQSPSGEQRAAHLARASPSKVIGRSSSTSRSSSAAASGWRVRAAASAMSMIAAAGSTGAPSTR